MNRRVIELDTRLHHESDDPRPRIGQAAGGKRTLVGIDGLLHAYATGRLNKRWHLIVPCLCHGGFEHKRMRAANRIDADDVPASVPTQDREHVGQSAARLHGIPAVLCTDRHVHCSSLCPASA